MRPLLVLTLFLALISPAIAQGDLAPEEYDPSVPWPIVPLDLATANMEDMGTWLYNISDSYGLLGIQYPKDNEWYYSTIEKIITHAPGQLTVADTSYACKAGGQIPDPKTYTTIKLTDIDPATITLTEVLPFDGLLGAKSTLGKEKGEYAAYYAEYRFPLWYTGVHKPAATKIWKITLHAHGKAALFSQESYAPSIDPVNPNKKTPKPNIGSFGILLSDKVAAEEAVKVLRRMAELGQQRKAGP